MAAKHNDVTEICILYLMVATPCDVKLVIRRMNTNAGWVVKLETFLSSNVKKLGLVVRTPECDD